MVSEQLAYCKEDEEEVSQSDKSSRRSFQLMKSKELATSDFRIEYLVDNVIPVGEPGLIAGRSKSLKTTIAIDLATSVTSGLPFLGRFPVKRRGRAAIFSAESGAAVMKETALRICRSKEVELDELELGWSFESPQIGSETEMLRHTIEDNELDLLVIDPAYWALGEVADSLANATKMATVLRPLSEISHRTNCAILLVAHTKKPQTGERGPRFPVPSLFDVAGAGLDQWARYALLLGPRRDWDYQTGQHALWMNQMGSAVPNNLWGVDVREGRLDQPGGRIWEVAVLDKEKLRIQEEEGKVERKSTSKNATLERHAVRTLEAILANPDGLSQTAACGGMSGTEARKTIQRLLDDGSIVPITRGSQTRYVATSNARAA